MEPLIGARGVQSCLLCYRLNKLYFGDNLNILREPLAVGTCCARPFVWNRTFCGHARSGRAQHVPTPYFEGLMNGTERPRFPDLTLGRSTFKRAAVEDMGAEQEKLL